VNLPDLPEHALAPPRLRCGCALHARRAFTGLLLAGAAAPALAQIPECKRSKIADLVPAESVESSAGQQYQQLLRQAADKRALAPKDHPQLVRLRSIAQRMIPFAPECNPRARDWKWEVNLLGSAQVNAFCMPGGKIAFFYGILARLQLSDDEVAFIMGHEVSHALLEHAREQMGKNTGTSLLLRGGAALLGLGSLGDLAAQAGGQLLAKAYSRQDETEADRLGMIMSARAGYDPRAGVTLWQKMMAGGNGGPPAWLSTHPTNEERIAEIEKRLSRVEPLYDAAGKPPQRFAPPPMPEAKTDPKPKSER
jgi:predicted Zn-dependent protease